MHFASVLENCNCRIMHLYNKPCCKTKCNITLVEVYGYVQSPAQTGRVIQAMNSKRARIMYNNQGCFWNTCSQWSWSWVILWFICRLMLWTSGSSLHTQIYLCVGIFYRVVITILRYYPMWLCYGTILCNYHMLDPCDNVISSLQTVTHSWAYRDG